MVVWPRKVAKIQLCVVLSLITANVAAQYIQYCFLGYEKSYWSIRMFDFDSENNLPTWYQSLALLLSALLLWLVYLQQKARHAGFQRHWLALACIFAFLAAEEAALGLHERIDVPLRAYLNTSGLLYNPWVLVGMAGVAALAASYFRFLLNLPPRTRWLMIFSGVIYVSGAIGVECIGWAWAETHGFKNLVYAMNVTIEESMEMLGIVLFTYALARHLGDMKSMLSIRIACSEELTPVPFGAREPVGQFGLVGLNHYQSTSAQDL